ncbi:helix-turn-helix domain-containing protein [Myxococcota bacterium]
MATDVDQKLQQRLAQRCRQLRAERGLSQMDMVRQFEFSLSHYQKIERGVLDCRLTTLDRLADCFELTLSDLLEGV